MRERGESFINVEILNEITGKSKTISFLIDTGFNGYIQLSELDVSELGLVIENKAISRLANGSVVETGITKTKIKILDEEISNLPIQFLKNGVALIGTGFLKFTNRMALFDYEDGYITLTRIPEIKAKIKLLVDEMAN